MTEQEMENTQRITEENIMLSFLSVLASANDFYGYQQKVPTEIIKEALKESLPLSEEDTRIVEGKRGTKVDRVIRNLASHDKPVKRGYAIRNKDGWQITEKGKDILLDVLISEIGFSPDFDELEQNPRSIDYNLISSAQKEEEDVTRLTENNILDDFIFVLIRADHFYKAKGEDDKFIPTSTIKNILKHHLPLTEEDIKPLKNRKDTKVDQVIRNLASHDTPVKRGYATRNKDGWQVSEKGKDFILSIFLKKFGIQYDFEDISNKIQDKKEADWRKNLKQYQKPAKKNKTKP